MGTTRWQGLAGFCMLAAMMLLAAWASAELKPGDVLDKSTWQEAKGMMPEAILKRFAGGEHISKIVELPPEAVRFGRKFLERSEANQQLYDVDNRGVWIEKSTGTWP